MGDLEVRLGLSILIAIAISAGLALAVLEYLPNRGQASSGMSLDTRLSLASILPNALTYLLLAPWWSFVYLSVADISRASYGVSAVTVLTAFVACDLSYYVEHRSAHQIRPLWRLYHATHHNCAVYHIPLAYRVNFINQFFAPFFYLPWVYLGLPPILVLGFQLFVFHYQAWIHTERIGSLGILDRVMNTPAVHRMHHSVLPEHRAVNLGAVFLLWDHLFGTYAATADQVTYGVTDMRPSTTFMGLYLDPWRSPDEGGAG